MAENFDGKIINDQSVVFPTMRDYRHNALMTFLNKNKQTAQSLHYIEDPPGGKGDNIEAVGTNMAGTIFSVKPQNNYSVKDVVLMNNEDIFTGIFCPQSISIDMSKMTAGENSDDVNYFNQLTSTERFQRWMSGLSFSSEREYELSSSYIDKVMVCSLMYTEVPELDKYTIKLIKKDKVEEKKYTTNYPYESTVSHYIPEFIDSKIYGPQISYSGTYNDGDTIYLYDKKQVWEYYPCKENSAYAYYLSINKRGVSGSDRDKAYSVRDKMVEALNKATDIRVCVSMNTIALSSDQYADKFPASWYEDYWLIPDPLLDVANSIFNDNYYKYFGFNVYGHDKNNKCTSVIYIKADLDGKGEQWINFNKYIIYLSLGQNFENQKYNSPYDESMGEYTDAFDAASYDLATKAYQDNFWVNSQLFGFNKRRRELQEKAFKEAGAHLCKTSDLEDWTVSIGDVTFFVPPAAIRMLNQTMTERLPVIRAKGSMVKNIEKADSELELSLYFNRDSGINGVPVETPRCHIVDILPNGELKDEDSKQIETYYMNGLRALISEFKFTPFLPIVNKYINETLNIYAVSLEELGIQTVPNFPRLIQAIIRLKKFDYNVYMPEIPEPYYKGENDDVLVNPYAECINYDVMRWYYQRPILYGNELYNKLKNISGYTFNSTSFFEDTLFKNRTALMPCDFLDPNIDIYIANETHLQKLMEVKQEQINKLKTGVASNSFTPNDLQEDAIRDLGSINPAYNTIYDKYKSRVNSVIAAVKTAYSSNNEFYRPFSLDLTAAGLEHYQINLIEQFDSDISIMFENIRDNYILKPMLEELQNEFSDFINIDGQYLFRRFYIEQGFIYGQINVDYISDPEDLDTIIQQAFAGNSKVSSDDVEKVFDNNRIKIGLTDWDIISKGLPQDWNSVTQSFLKTDLDKIFIDWCTDYSSSTYQGNQEAQELKEASDWENIRSLKFDLIGENIRVDSFECQMKNNFSRISLLDSDGFAPQYIGSQDIHITWKITTKDANFAGLMRGLPEFEAYCMRKYHLVLPSFPVRIDSEFTRMIGVHEVSIEETLVNTVPNFPGLYEITVRAISTDRTMRNREALRSLGNTDPNESTGQSGELNSENTSSNESGLSTGEAATQAKVRSFSELNSKLARAELYPDLELPKIKELANLGFRFIRYKEKERDAEDLYVDPDFYFVYPTNTRADIIRANLEARFGGDEPYGFNNAVFSDNSGSKVTLSYDGEQPKVDSSNEAFKKATEDILKARDIAEQSKTKTRNIMMAEIIPSALFGDPDLWNISPSIAVSFMESNYFDLCKALDKKDNETSKQDSKITSALTDLKTFYDDKMKGLDESIAKLYNEIRDNPLSEDDYSAWFVDGDRNYLNNHKTDFANLYFGSTGTIEVEGRNYQNTDYGDFASSVSNMIDAAWAAYTGLYEYNEELYDGQWRGRGDYYGEYKDSNNATVLLKKADLETVNRSTIIRAGIFKISRLTETELKTLLSKKEVEEFEAAKRAWEADKKTYTSFVLDPYYRLHPDQINDYLYNCCNDQDYAKAAFMRIVFWWLLKLYENKIFPSISLDVMRKEALNASEAKNRAETLVKKVYGEDTNVDVDEDLIDNIKEFAEANGASLDSGKIFAAITLALYNQPLNNNKIYTWMNTRNYDALNNHIQSVIGYKYKDRKDVNSPDSKFRKFLFALVGVGEVGGTGYLGLKKDTTPAQNYVSTRNTKIAIEAAKDPKQYIFHSFYDMCRGDYRGRMLRAFPTFYCVFMDEGKEIGLWKLHDNFYSMNSIYEIVVAKSRKIAADTCTIVLSNNYSTFTTDDEDGYINYQGSWGELWDSMVQNKDAAERAAKQRLAARFVNRAKLQPGIRIHVREGYGSDARELGTVFNGVIASVTPGAQAVNIVAQGNGIELMNPFLEDRDADEIQFKDKTDSAINNTEGRGASPGRILSSILTTKGSGWENYKSGNYSDNQFFFNRYGEGLLDSWINADEDSWINATSQWMKEEAGKNPYGIRNFGDPAYKDTFPDGEIVQNIYDITDIPHMYAEGVNVNDEYNDTFFKPDELEAPWISIETRGKTFWDIMHICKSVGPDYITSTAPFGFRDTIFLGRPHYYYAYDYSTDENGFTVEKRKPFQQYHFLFSDSDIIENSITATANFPTVATGLYKNVHGTFTCNEDVGPLWIDKDIYPEYQRSVVVDTRLYMKDGVPWKTDQNSFRMNGFDSENYPLDGALDFVANAGQSLFNNPAFSFVYGVIDWGLDVVTELFEDDKGEFSSHKKIAWAATANALKEGQKEMYQGTLTIMGDPFIKPYDRIVLADTYNDMTGQVLVRDVTHILNAQTGFTTTISIDAISVVDDREEMERQTLIGDVLAYIVETGLLSLPVMRAYTKGASILTKMGKKISQYVTPEMKAAIESAGDDGKTVQEFFSGLWKIIKGMIGANKIAAAIKLFVRLLLKTAFKDIVLVFEAVAWITSNLLECFTNFVKDRQVLIVFPLKKNGLPYTAGLTGSKGLVYGSSTWKDVGWLESKIADYLSVSAEDNEFWAWLKECFTTEEVANAAARYRRDFDVFSPISSTALFNQQQSESLSIGLIKNYGFKQQNTVLGLSIFPRAIVRDVRNTNQIKYYSDALEPYYVRDIQDILGDQNKKNHLLISDYHDLKPYIENKNHFLEIVHENLDAPENSGYKYITKDVIIEKKQVKINCLTSIQTINNKEYEILDVPFLAKDALIVLKEIVEEAYKTIANSNAKDFVQSEIDNNNSKVIVTSALMIGSPFKQTSSGYSFAIRGTGKLENSLRVIIEGYRKDLKTRLNLRSNKPSYDSFYDLLETKGIPDYKGEPYIILNNNEPEFTEEDLNKDIGIYLEDLDSLGRARGAFQIFTQNTIPSSDTERESLYVYIPGYEGNNRKYDFITNIATEASESNSNKYIYNKCHLIAHRFSGLNNEPKNLTTGTNALNYNMLEFVEDPVKQALEKNPNMKVAYRVTPYYAGNNLLCSGVQMEVVSIEDSGIGKTLKMNYFFYNVQDGVAIDYATGYNEEAKEDYTYSILPNGNETYFEKEPAFEIVTFDTSNDIRINVYPPTPIGE